MDFVTKIKEIFFKASTIETDKTLHEIDGVTVRLKKSYVRLKRSEISGKCEPIEKKKNRIMIPEDSSDLPDGWSRYKLKRLTGETWDRYVQNPEGKKFNKQKNIDEHLAKINSNLKIMFQPPGPQAQQSSFVKKSITSNDITKYMVKREEKVRKGEEEKENICDNVIQELNTVETSDTDREDVKESSGEANNRKQASTRDLSSESETRKKRKANNRDFDRKRKKPNIVEFLSDSLDKDGKCPEEPNVPEEIPKVNFDENLNSDCIGECSNISEVTDEFVAENDGVEANDKNVHHIEAETNDSDSDPSPVEDDLPPGWSRKEVKKAFSKHEVIVIVQAPDGKQFDSQKKLNSFLARNKMQFKINLDDGPVEKIKPQEENPESTEDPEKTIDKGKKRGKFKKEDTVETDRNLTNDEIDEECDREFCQQDRYYIEEIDKFMKETGLNLKASPPTKGDGNCWFRAVADQVVLQNIPDKAKNHRALRLEVCDHVKLLPEDIRETTIAIVFNGKKRGLSEMVARQRRAGQWVDNTGIMVLTTAHYLARNIHLYSYRSETRDNTRPYSLTKIEAGAEAEKHQPVTLFFYDKHYQTLQPDTPQESDNTDEKTE